MIMTAKDKLFLFLDYSIQCFLSLYLLIVIIFEQIRKIKIFIVFLLKYAGY